MLRAFADLTQLSIGARDGEFGAVKDAYFDDREWTVRYLIAATGNWFSGGRTLIAPHAIRAVNWNDRRLEVNLTREQVKQAPSIDVDKPVSRQHEMAYFDYYGYPYYWTGLHAWGPMPLPALTGGVTDERALSSGARRERRERDEGDPNLRSAKEVAGYHIEAADGDIGHVEDFLFDDADWSLRYFIVDTRNWLPGRKVLISTDWIERVSWEGHKTYVALLREEVRNSPEYKPASFNESDEADLHRHYGRTPERTPTRVQIR